MIWDLINFGLLLVCLAELTYIMRTSVRRYRELRATVVTQAAHLAELHARMARTEHLTHMSLMAHAGLCTVTYRDGDGFDDATIAAAFHPSEPVVDLDELRRTGTTPIRGFRHNLYDNGQEGETR